MASEFGGILGRVVLGVERRPVLRPSEFVTVGSMEQHGTTDRNMASYRDDLDIRERATTFDGMVAFDYESVGITTRAGDSPRIRLANFVSDNFFRVLGIDPSLGRRLVPFSHHVDGATYSFVVPLIVATTVLAALVPARRAARVNPTTALRYE